MVKINGEGKISKFPINGEKKLLCATEQNETPQNIAIFMIMISSKLVEILTNGVNPQKKGERQQRGNSSGCVVL